ncbi:hypothetical protein BC939DRAFT_521978 [Gamsiella multidivaricata]|uniref:uncharacterized protein n=1 Tax=Gamsiella multidivaricata TaxID=101098 RepID=UPI002220D5CC|nr:uncharacterized protein BC939DRAFT_521978 [Gamsiella multidivaricata]KAI7818673.1 hypothetical protein BC939DRAFT_521978 [Gamsiella multidivaricata]
MRKVANRESKCGQGSPCPQKQSLLLTLPLLKKSFSQMGRTSVILNQLLCILKMTFRFPRRLRDRVADPLNQVLEFALALAVFENGFDFPFAFISLTRIILNREREQFRRCCIRELRSIADNDGFQQGDVENGVDLAVRVQRQAIIQGAGSISDLERTKILRAELLAFGMELGPR